MMMNLISFLKIYHKVYPFIITNKNKNKIKIKKKIKINIKKMIKIKIKKKIKKKYKISNISYNNKNLKICISTANFRK